MNIFQSFGLGVTSASILSLCLAWKWDFGVRRATLLIGGAGLASLLCGLMLKRVVSLGPAFEAVVAFACTMAFMTLFVLWRFYRDPERTTPDATDCIVSPADGEVIYVRQARGGSLPVATKNGRNYRLDELTKTTLRDADATVIGIAMTFLDVHVNRAPITGKISLHRHFSGWFGSLRKPEMVFENERATTVFEAGPIQVAVVQIASRLVRQIVSFVHEGQEVSVGQRIGAIRFGSQVDVVLPLIPEIKIVVQPGMRVHAGESLIALLEPKWRNHFQSVDSSKSNNERLCSRRELHAADH